MEKKRVRTAEEVLSHFRTLEATPSQLRFIDTVAMKDQYIVVTHGRDAIKEYQMYQETYNRPIEKSIRVKDKIGHCTRCHHQFVLPAALASVQDVNPIQRCPVCHGMGRLVSGYRSMGNRTIMQYVTFFESSKKDPDVILGKSIVAVRTVEEDYRTCKTITYPVTVYYFKRGETPLMYKRDVWYSRETHEFQPYYAFFENLYGYEPGRDGLGTHWKRQKTIGSLHTQYWNRGYEPVFNYQDFLRMMQKKAWKYCQAEVFFKASHIREIRLQDCLAYLTAYVKHPQLEYLVKANMSSIVDSLLFGGAWTGRAINWSGKKNKDFLRVKLTKADKQYMRSHAVNAETFNTYAIAQEQGQTVSLQDVCAFRKIALIRYDRSVYRANHDFLPDIKKIMRYVKKQQGKGPRNMKAHVIISDYMDYIKECIALRYDLQDKSIRWPQDLSKAHQATTRLYQLKREEIRAEQQTRSNQKYDDQIRKQCQELQGYCFENERFFIRPAASVAEMIEEGMKNHNCVGTYIQAYAAGKTHVFVIREKAAPENVFYTLELRGQVIIQCRTDRNQIAPEGSPVDVFIKAFERFKVVAVAEGETA